ncbi:uncharacterized protein LOC130592111 [Beta vulgaris subsp. vulgaris]|uniref:uncharacterized protein LOC130592111 n=1 Tax=Beta vulgaris subsp. vulgaris TaxID=3555 RepID=UPI0025487990|nr:uncharacterized protein LOC130592111 [Beta vulgaris subsp. vulgaris]
MELYDGENANEFPLVDLKRAATKNFQRCKLALCLMEHPLNKLKDKVKRDCYVWSANKPELIARQKLRKEKKGFLNRLAVNRSKKTNKEEPRILERRRKHEEEVETVLNDHYEDKERLNKLLNFGYS